MKENNMEKRENMFAGLSGETLDTVAGGTGSSGVREGDYVVSQKKTDLPLLRKCFSGKGGPGGKAGSSGPYGLLQDLQLPAQRRI